VEIFIAAQQAERAGELASLRAWLDVPGEGVQWVLAPPAADGDTLGVGVEEICAVITAADALVRLVEWVRNWRESRQDPPAVILTLPIGAVPAVPAAASGDGDGSGDGAEAGHDDEPDT
jgi:hypothetical protein